MRIHAFYRDGGFCGEIELCELSFLPGPTLPRQAAHIPPPSPSRIHDRTKTSDVAATASDCPVNGRAPAMPNAEVLAKIQELRT